MKIVLTVLDVYALLLILFLLLMLIPQRPWIVELLSNLLHWALLPSLLMLIVSIAMRQWRSAAIWAIPTLAFLILFGGLFLPDFSRDHTCNPNDPSCVHLRVMTFNLLGGPIPDRQPQIDIMRDSGADIIALQEVNQDGLAVIENQLADIYPYQVLFPNGIGGTGIISKYPIENHEIFILTLDVLKETIATIDVQGKPITVISAHTRPPLSIPDLSTESQRFTDIRSLAEMATRGGPTLLIGDFNITDMSQIYRVLTGVGLKDTFREVGWGFGSTWPARFHPPNERAIPLVRLDYIWHTDEFHAESVWVGPHTASDHLPVIADLVYEW